MSKYISEQFRKYVAERANFQCEYCHIYQEDAFFPFHIDHIISLKHGGLTILENLAYTCSFCNSFKGTDVGTILFPKQKFIRLFNPRKDSWSAHLEIGDFVFYALTDIGAATIKVLNLNEVVRIIERRTIARN